MKRRIIDRINRIADKSKTKSEYYVLSIIPIKVDKEHDNFICIMCRQNGMNLLEQFNIEKLYYTDSVKLAVTESIAKSQPIRVKCVKYRGFHNGLSKMHSTWKVIQIQADTMSHDWIDVDEHSKLF